jgi:hypothetical protein
MLFFGVFGSFGGFFTDILFGVFELPMQRKRPKTQLKTITEKVTRNVSHFLGLDAWGPPAVCGKGDKALCSEKKVIKKNSKASVLPFSGHRA